MNPRRLDRLLAVTDAARIAAEARHAALLHEERALAQQIAELNAARRTGPDVAAPAFAAGADVKWQSWVDGRIVTLNADLARTRAARLSARDALRKAFGRQTAVAGLLDRENEEQRLIKSRKGSFG